MGEVHLDDIIYENRDYDHWRPHYVDPDVFSWDDNERAYREFQFTGSPGVKVFPQDRSCPLSTLNTFLTEELISDIVAYTNSYAEILRSHPALAERMSQSNRSMLNLWEEVTVDEVWIHIALQILMGIIHKPHYHMYWSSDAILTTPIFSRLMRRDRFEQIRSMLHFTDPLAEDVADPLKKLSTFLNYLEQKFMENYIPSQHISVDEYLSSWKGRLGFRQYIPSKRDRYGVKIYMLCESDSAYLWKFIIYTGKSTAYPPPSISLPKPFIDYKNPSKVVLSLLDGLYNQGYNVALDNLYTSPELLRALLLNDTDAYGTLRKKTGLPDDFWQWKPIKEEGRQPMRMFCNELMVCRWNDSYKTKKKKVVSMLSTKHTGLLKDTGKVDFRSKRAMFKPDVIVEYNETMGGVDTLSRVMDPYGIQRKGLKWYRKIGELFIELSIYNSYVVWRKLNVGKTQLDYRIDLVKQIISFHLFGQQAHQFNVKRHDQPMRLLERHFIRRMAHGDKRVRKDCVRCKALGLRVATMYHCPTCNVAICVDECFEIYHTKKDITSYIGGNTDPNISVMDSTMDTSSMSTD